MPTDTYQSVLRSRRQMLRECGAGFGAWALTDLLAGDGAIAASAKPHFAPRAKSVIFLFMQGGPSHIDTFDPKPLLKKLHGKPLPESITKDLRLRFTKLNALVHGCPQAFSKCGESGIEIANSYPNLQTCADELAVVRSCWHESFNHGPGQYMMNCGSPRQDKPSLGAWVTYGLGSESKDLPSFVVLTTTGSLKGGPAVYGRGFLPGQFQPTVLRNEGSPILYLDRPGAAAQYDQRALVDLTQWLNRRHLAERGDDVDDLSARIESYELAFRMQTGTREVVDINREPKHIHDLYGLGDPASRTFGKCCLTARRLVERGVRFVQVFTGSSGKDDWDRAHADNDKVHGEMARLTDRPIAALLKDLKQRGLLDSTLVIWGGEFGRTPVTDGREPKKPPGRDHNPYGFTTWLAGAGIRGGQIIGATDETGFRAIEDPIHVHDLHATILTLLGIDHKQLTYLFEGRDQRLTDIGGQNEFSARLLN